MKLIVVVYALVVFLFGIVPWLYVLVTTVWDTKNGFRLRTNWSEQWIFRLITFIFTLIFLDFTIIQLYLYLMDILPYQSKPGDISAVFLSLAIGFQYLAAVNQYYILSDQKQQKLIGYTIRKDVWLLVTLLYLIISILSNTLLFVSYSLGQTVHDIGNYMSGANFLLFGITEAILNFEMTRIVLQSSINDLSHTVRSKIQRRRRRVMIVLGIISILDIVMIFLYVGSEFINSKLAFDSFMIITNTYPCSRSALAFKLLDMLLETQRTH